MNGVEILPPDFNAAEKYPVLFSVYGGPGSQKVSYQFDLSWHTFLASKLRYIVVSVIAECSVEVGNRVMTFLFSGGWPRHRL